MDADRFIAFCDFLDGFHVGLERLQRGDIGQRNHDVGQARINHLNGHRRKIVHHAESIVNFTTFSDNSLNAWFRHLHHHFLACLNGEVAGFGVAEALPRGHSFLMQQIERGDGGMATQFHFRLGGEVADGELLGRVTADEGRFRIAQLGGDV